MKNARHVRWFSLIVIATLLMGCSMGAAAPTATPVPPTNTPIPPTATPVPPTATPLPTETPLPTPTPGPIVIDDDFSVDNGRFKCDNCVVEGGILTVGPFEYIDSREPFKAICSDCGIAKKFKMSVDVWYTEGNNSYGFGVLLRDSESENDEDLFATVTTNQKYNVFRFDPTVGGGVGWTSMIGGWKLGPMRPGRGVNNIEYVMDNLTLTVTINGDFLRTVDIPSGSGQVGLYVSNFMVGAAFDNFHFEEIR